MSELEAGQQLAEYILVESLGGGAFSEAWLAHHEDDESTPLVIKAATHPLYIQWMADQQTFAIPVDHGNLLLADEINFSELPPYLVYEHIPGDSMRDLVELGLQFDQHGVLALIRQVASGIAALHEIGEFHGMLTPNNVRLAESGEVLVLDVETARITRDLALLIMRTPAAPAELKQMLPFLAPEEVAQAGRTDVRADVYSIGSLYYYLLTHELPPESGISEEELAGQPIQVQALILDCLAPVDVRIESALVLLDRLERLASALPAPEYDEEEEALEEEAAEAVGAEAGDALAYDSDFEEAITSEDWDGESGEYITAD